jgi:hypothetical protein
MKALTIEQLEFLAAKGLTMEEAIAFAKMGPAKSRAAERTARWRARKNGNVTQSVTGDGHGDASPPPIDNHTPPVSSDEETKPVAKRTRKAAPVLAERPREVPEKVWRDFIGQRKTPFTETALDGVCAEAAKAGWTITAALTEAVARGWQSFKAEWVAGRKAALANDPADFLAHYAAKQARGP